MLITSSSPQIAVTQQNRKALKKILEYNSLEKLNAIPSGFNNNIYWNCAHVVAVQQRLIYRLSGMSYTLPDLWVREFLPGTKPQRIYTQEDVNELISLMIQSFDQLQSDLSAGVFKDVQPFMTALRFEIKSFEDAVTFNLFHEALHMGHILNLMKFV